MTKEMMEIEYNRARNLIASEDLNKLIEARDILTELDDYKESKKYLEKVVTEINSMNADLEEKKEEDYERAVMLMKEKKSAQRLDQAMKLFKALGDYKDSAELLEKCQQLRTSVSIKDKKDLDRLKLIGYLFAGIGVIAIFVIICAMIWQTVSGGQ